MLGFHHQIGSLFRLLFQSLTVRNVLAAAMVFCLLAPQGAYAQSASGPTGVLMTSPVPDQPMKIEAIQYESGAAGGNAGVLRVLLNKSFNESDYPTVLKLPNPFRFVVDFPHATLASPQSRIPVKKDGIEQIELSETRGVFYNAVRMTVTVSNPDVLNRLRTEFDNRGLVITGAAPSSRIALNSPVPQQALKLFADDSRNVITDVFFRDDRLFIQSRKDNKLVIKNQFTLKDPHRLVLDIDQAVVANKGLLQPISVDNGAVRQVRVGQFEDDVVRVVIETPSPEKLNIVYPSLDKTLLSIGQGLGSTIATLPADTELGVLQNIEVLKNNDETVIRLTSSTPMIEKISRDNRNVLVDLLNVASNPGWVNFDKDAFSDLSSLKLESLTAGEPNSKLVIALENPKATQIETRQSTDGKILELVLFGQANAQQVTKAPFPARIVVDAGHGGKDQGADRGGILEKDLNLKVALQLKRALEARGMKVQMTRTSDVFLPLSSIVSIANSAHPDLFISIHSNASVNPAIAGLETYYYNQRSLPLAKRIHRQIVNNVNTPDRGVRRAMFYVIHHTTMPAILCEMGYLSNDQERHDMISPERQQKLVNSMAEGVVEYLNARVSANAQ